MESYLTIWDNFIELIQFQREYDYFELIELPF